MRSKEMIILALLLVVLAVAAIIHGCGEGVLTDFEEAKGPVITNLGPVSVTVATTPVSSQLCTIEISWVTDVPATTKVIYFLTPDGSGVPATYESLALVTTHIATITAFSDDFSYRAASMNSNGWEVLSSVDTPIRYVTMASTPGPDMDAYMDQGPGVAFNYGGSPTLNVGDGGGFEYRAILSFEVSSHVPSNRHISYAALILNCLAMSPPMSIPQNVVVYPNMEFWFEGVDNGALTQPGVTWLSPIAAPPWVAPFNPVYLAPLGGGSFPPVPLAMGLVVGPGIWYFGDVLPGLPFGLIVAYNPAALPIPGDFRIFSSREGPNPPRLKLYLVK